MARALAGSSRVLFLLFVSLLARPAEAALCYVNAAAGGSNNGASWANAYTDLQSALVQPGCLLVWVARGTYRPTSGNDRTISFNLRPGAEVYGGFNGTEATLGARQLPANPTILSGDIGVAGDASDNSYHVVVMDGTTASGTIVTANLLSDFTIRDGNADGPGADQGNGGGLFCNGSGAGHECSPELTNLIFEHNSAAAAGAAIFNDGHGGGKSSPWLHDAIIRDNQVPGGAGGGIYNYAGGSGSVASPLIEQVSFSGNSADLGGAIYGYGNGGTSNPTIRNATFYANTATTHGGALVNYGVNGHASPIIRYSTFNKNRAVNGQGGAIYNIAPGADAAPNLSGVILWGDQANGSPKENYTAFSATTSSLEYSITPECPGGATGCINADPLLLPLADNGGFAPTLIPDAGSPATDNGNAGNCPADDARLVARPQGAKCDIGAVELKTADTQRCYVNAFAGQPADGKSWATAYPLLQNALLDPCNSIWVAQGTYKPDAGLGDRHSIFRIFPGKRLHGGFLPGATALGQRDPVAHPTILSGDIGVVGEISDNSYHVVVLDAFSNGNISDATIVDGFTITGGNANAGTAPDAFGGGMICNGNGAGVVCSPTLSNLRFENNQAAIGGGLALIGFQGDSSPVMTHVDFVGNHASQFCGALYVYGTSGRSSPVVAGASFTSNTADNAGGAVCAVASTGGVSKPLFATALFDRNAAHDGGAAYLEAAQTIFTNATFRGNFANLRGGAVWDSDASGASNVLFVSSSFAENRAVNGGAVLLDHSTHASVAHFDRAMFAGNVTATDPGNGGWGGAFWADGGDTTVVDSLFANNGPSIGAGAIMANLGTVTVDRSAFVGNHAYDSGGAVYDQGGSVTITNSSFRANAAGAYGGAASVAGLLQKAAGGTLFMRNVTVAGNNAGAGGALSVDGDNAGLPSAATVSDSIFWGDVAPTDAEVHRGAQAIINIDHGIQQGGCAVGYTCNFVSSADPQLLSLFQTYGGLTPLLMPNVHSPAINAGSACTSADQRDVARPQGPGCDIGAAELKTTDDTLFNDAFSDSASEPAGYDPTQCASVVNSLDIYWVDANNATCKGIEHTDGNFVDAADGSFSMTGLSIVPANACLTTAAYSFTLSANGRTLSGNDTLGNVPMTLTRSSDGNCFVGHWISGGADFIATIWNFTRQ